jgi:hypothetical protein
MEFNISVSNNYEDNDKHGSLFDYIYVLVLIIYAGGANTFVRAQELDEPLALFLPLILSGILALQRKIVFNKQIYSLLFCYLFYFIFSTIKYKEIHPAFFALFLIKFLVAYITIKALKSRLFMIYELLMYYLAIISIFMWVVQFSGGDSLYSFASKIPNILKFSSVTGGGINLLLYSVQPSSWLLVSGSAIPRNCGFAWEPGVFSVYLCLAIYINIFIVKDRSKSLFRLWTFFLALLLTQSTTGYSILLFIIIFYFLQKNAKIVLLVLPILIVVVITVFSLPFMRNKISDLITESANYELIVENSVGSEIMRQPQRFTSFLISFKDFLNNPILGFGGHYEDRWFAKIDANLFPVSGIGNFLAQYGLTGFLFFIILLINNSLYFSNYFGYKGKYLLFFIIFLISISYSLFLLPIVMCFWMFSFFDQNPLQNIDKVRSNDIPFEPNKL